MAKKIKNIPKPDRFSEFLTIVIFFFYKAKNSNIATAMGSFFNAVKGKNNESKTRKPMWIGYISNKLCNLLLQLIIVILPLLVYHKFQELSEIEKIQWHGLGSVSDFYYFYKMKVLLWLSFLLLIAFSIRTYYTGLKKSFYYYPIAILGALILLSALFSDNKAIALNGCFYLMESMYVLLAYLLLTVVSLNVVATKKEIQRICISLFISALIGAIIGFSQFYKQDISFLFWQLLSGNTDAIKIASNGVFSTLANSNYVGSWMSLVVPILFILSIYLPRKKHRIGVVFLFLMLLFLTVLSKSRASFVMLTFLFIFYIIYQFKNSKTRLPRLLITIGAILLVLGISNLLLTPKKGDVVAQSPHAKALTFDTTPYIDAVIIDSNQVQIKTSIGSFRLLAIAEYLQIFNNQNKKIIFNVAQEKGLLTTKDSLLSQFKITIESYRSYFIFRIQKNEILLSFVLEKGIFFYLDSYLNRHTEIPQIATIDIGRKGHLGSGRLFIWSRTVPLLRKFLFFGAGADNFPFVFPQNDFIGKINAFGDDNLIVEKPHNYYLQTAINNGVLALLITVFMFLYYTIDSLKLYYQATLQTTHEQYGIALFFGLLGFMLISVFNDSMIGVSPLFWILLGVGININKQVKRTHKIHY